MPYVRPSTALSLSHGDKTCLNRLNVLFPSAPISQTDWASSSGHVHGQQVSGANSMLAIHPRQLQPFSTNSQSSHRPSTWNLTDYTSKPYQPQRARALLSVFERALK
eukprot:379573-Amphidinium_carterae.1